MLDADRSTLIDKVLTSGTKSHDRFTYVAGPVDSIGKIATYTVRADPVDPGRTLLNHYYTDQSGVIREEKAKEANQNSKPIGD